MSHLPLKQRIGKVEITITDPVTAGSYQDFKLIYTVGYFGIDDTGSIKICLRRATDMGEPQLTEPAEANYVHIWATNGAKLQSRYDPKDNVRPWGKVLYIKIIDGFLQEGDQIIAHFGDRAQGSTGIRMQTFCEETFAFKVLVDPFATYTYTEVPDCPNIKVVAGPAEVWKAQVPTLRRINESFRLLVKAEDRWGNPTPEGHKVFQCSSNLKIEGLPESITLDSQSKGVAIIEGLVPMEEGNLIITLKDKTGFVIKTNPMHVVEKATLGHYWGDLHGQSEETIGTKSVEDYFSFARDKAGLDFASHQANDFQITKAFWAKLQQTTKNFLKEGSFVTFPGYEWSGNTGLGGDHNVFYYEEGETIHRSSHALIADISDLNTDCNHIKDLFEALKNKKALIFAHVGGRYADLSFHSPRLQRSVEIHSAWGTFEWLLEEAFQKGYRIGIVCNSDEHKGRLGASYPGASLFGSYGGLTCLLAESLTRSSIWNALMKRHHYGTTGARIYLDVCASFSKPALRFQEEPHPGQVPAEKMTEAIMGDIIKTTEKEVTLKIELIGSAPIEKIEIHNGIELLETFRPYKESNLGHRIRVIWSGASFRGRERAVSWDGNAQVKGNEILSATAINFLNPEKKLILRKPDSLFWQSITTGGLAGFDCLLKEPDAGTLFIETPLVKFSKPVSEIGLKETIYETGGVARRMRLSRLPDNNPHTQLKMNRRISLKKNKDNPLYVCVYQEDGHCAWSSPIYVLYEDF